MLPADVSIVTVVRDRIHHLDHLGHNLRSYFSGEIVVVDVDDAPEVGRLCETFQATRVRIPRDPDGTFRKTRALNAGVAQSRGRFVVLNDVDCLHVNRLADVFLQLHAAHEHCIIHPPRIRTTLPYVDLARLMAKGNIDEIRAAGFIDRTPLFWPQTSSENAPCPTDRWLTVYGYCLGMSREVFEKARGFDEDMIGCVHEDIEFTYRAHRAGVRFIYTNQTAVLHMEHPAHPDRNAWGDINAAYILRKHGIDIFAEARRLG